MTVHEYPPFYNSIGARRLTNATGVPHVLEVHHIVGYPVAASMAETIGRWMSRIYLPFAINMAAGARAVNKSTAETLIRWGAKANHIRVVPSFYLDRALVESLGAMPPKKYDVVFCGRLVANKGIPEILRALKKTLKASLLVIGDGPERARLENVAKSLKVDPRVEFRGWAATQREVLQAIRTAKVLVMNSTSEGGPRVPLEAMAAGVPVIVTKVGVMPETIIDGVNGFFTTGEPADLAQKIEKILTDTVLRERMGTEAMRILDRFEKHKLIEQYAKFLQGFASSTQRP